MTRRSHVRLRAAATALLAAAVLAGCAESAGSGDGPEERTYTDGMIGKDSGGDPVAGGTFDFGGYAEPSSLDPAVTIAAGSTGGVEMANIFGTLMRYDSEAQEYVPQLAESLESSEDGTQWTLTLREGVEFSNGEPFDSAAVKASQERYAAAKGPEAALWLDNVESVRTPDDRTVVYTLAGPWPDFGTILSTGPGMIVAPGSGEGAKFEPIGAGPFVVESWAQSEEIVLAANEGYWDGRPHLDKVRFVYLNSPEAGVDSLESGGLDSVLLRDASAVDSLLDQGYAGFSNVVAVSNVAIINAEKGRPGADVRVRRAMAHGIDPEVIRERAFDGHGPAGSTMFSDDSRWSTGAEGLEFDPEKARTLLEEAKADGYDGKITYLENSSPDRRALALAVKASLESVGFEVELDLVRTIGDQINKIAVSRDYDLSGWGLSFREGDPFSKMYATMHSSGTQTFGMATSDEMDAAIGELQQAGEDPGKQAAIEKIQELANEQVPHLNWGPVAEVSFWTDEVHGVTSGASSMFLLDEAWIG